MSATLQEDLNEERCTTKNSKVVLDREKARRIFKHKLDILNGCILRNGLKPQSASMTLAKFYGVSPQAIRDIWNRRTWAEATAGMESNDKIGDDSPFTKTNSCAKVTEKVSFVKPKQLCENVDATVDQFLPEMLYTMPLQDQRKFSTVASNDVPKRQDKEYELIFLKENDPFHNDWPHW
mmetsp:Transcript_87938/g.233870  ORF Transcript_87938/g.233870 Transcript_87938/m.233870 type:complete len:179 (+) Transcript_87938:65-601(+)